MSQLREVLDTLPLEDREALLYAFNELFCYVVDLPDNHFIGVHMADTAGKEIIESNGMWYYGRVLND